MAPGDSWIRGGVTLTEGTLVSPETWISSTSLGKLVPVMIISLAIGMSTM